MKHKILLFLLLILGISPFTNLKAQKIDNLLIALTSETYSFPFTRFVPIHPGLELGTTLFEKSKQNSVHAINVFLGGYYHRLVENGFYIKGEYVYTYQIKNTLGLNFPVGIGYQQSFYPGEIYEQNSETGKWEKITQLGTAHALVNIGLGFTYLKPEKVQPFVRYESVIDFPLNPSFMTTRTFFKLGVRIKITKTENE